MGINYNCIFRSFFGSVVDRMFSFSLSLSIPFAFEDLMSMGHNFTVGNKVVQPDFSLCSHVKQVSQDQNLKAEQLVWIIWQFKALFYYIRLIMAYIHKKISVSVARWYALQ